MRDNECEKKDNKNNIAYAIKASWEVSVKGKNCGTVFGHICSKCGYRFLDVLEETKFCASCGSKLIYGRLNKEESEKVPEKF